MWSGNTCVSSDKNDEYQSDDVCCQPRRHLANSLSPFLLIRPHSVSSCWMRHDLLIDCSMSPWECAHLSHLSPVFGPSCWLLLVAVTCLLWVLFSGCHLWSCGWTYCVVSEVTWLTAIGYWCICWCDHCLVCLYLWNWNISVIKEDLLGYYIYILG